MLHKNKILRCITSFILCLIIVANCNTFRKDTYAFAFAIPVVAGAGEVIFYIGGAAAAALAGIIAGMGISAATADDSDKLVSDWIEYDATTYGVDHTKGILSDAGFDVGTDEDNNVTVNLPGTRQATFTAEDDDFCDLVNPWPDGFTLDGGDSGGGNGDDSGGSGGDKTPLWKRIVCGMMAAGSGLGSIGASFYDFLHQEAEYEPPFTSLADTYDNIVTFVVDEAEREFLINYGFIPQDLGKDPILSASNFPADKFIQYKYIDIYCKFFLVETINGYDYCLGYSYGSHKNNAESFPDSNLTKGNHLGILCTSMVGYNSQTDFYIRGFEREAYVGSSATSISVTYTGVASVTADTLDEALTTKVIFGKNATVSDSYQIAHFVNLDYESDTDTDTDTDTELGKIIIDGRTYYITEGDNIYNNQQYVTQQIAGKTDGNGNVLVTAPQIDREANTITYPQYITYEGDEIVYGDTITYVNPAEIDLKEDIPLEQEDVDNQNIFKLLYNYFSSFWTKLRQVLRDFFVPDLSDVTDSFELLKTKFPIVQQVDVLLNKLLDYNFDTDGPPSFLIRYKTAALNYETAEQPMIDFSGISTAVTILHGIVLFIAYYCFGKKVVGKLTKVFQP